jgi:formylmethanofuran dehydrogenase subunit E
MFISAIADEEIDSDYLYIEKGQTIYGNVRSYAQLFMKVVQPLDYIRHGDNDDDYDVEEISRIIKVKIKKGSIRKVYCRYCECSDNKKATREIDGDLICDDCEYEWNSSFDTY